MKHTVALLLAGALGLAGCQSNNGGIKEPAPTQVPSEVKSQTTKPAEPSSTPTQSSPAEPTTQRPVPQPTKTGTGVPEAGTPATQFAARWGVRYPSVPKYAILKAANGVCAVIEQTGADWVSDAVAMNSIGQTATAFGLEKNQALEFAQDAGQNYCASIVNPA